MEIMRLSYVDNPEEYSRYQIRESFNPFSNKSEEEILVMLTSNLTTQFNKVLYLNLSLIFSKIEMENADFYRLAKKKQIELVKKEVDEIIKALDTTSTHPIPSES